MEGGGTIDRLRQPHRISFAASESGVAYQYTDDIDLENVVIGLRSRTAIPRTFFHIGNAAE